MEKFHNEFGKKIFGQMLPMLDGNVEKSMGAPSDRPSAAPDGKGPSMEKGPGLGGDEKRGPSPGRPTLDQEKPMSEDECKRHEEKVKAEFEKVLHEFQVEPNPDLSMKLFMVLCDNAKEHVKVDRKCKELPGAPEKGGAPDAEKKPNPFEKKEAPAGGDKPPFGGKQAPPFGGGAKPAPKMPFTGAPKI